MASFELPRASLSSSDTQSGEPKGKGLGDTFHDGFMESFTVGVRPLSFSAVVRSKELYQIDFLGTRRLVVDPQRTDLDDAANLLGAEGRIVGMEDGRVPNPCGPDGAIRIVLDLFEVDVTADGVAVRLCDRESVPAGGRLERLKDRLSFCPPGQVLYTGMVPWSDGRNTRIGTSAGWIEVEEFFSVASFTIDFTQSRVDLAFMARDGTAAAQVRFDLVTDVFVQPGRHEGIWAIDEDDPPTSMEVDDFDEVVVLPRREDSSGGRFLIHTGAFDLMVEARSVSFTQEG